MITFLILAVLLLFIAYIDYKTQTIPDFLNGAVCLLGVWGLFIDPSTAALFNAGLGALLGSGFFLLVAVLSRGAIGGGDIKLMFGLGLIFGALGIFLIMLMSCLIQALIAIGVLATKKKGMKAFIPFGPAIVMATFIQLVFGEFLRTLFGF